MSHPRSLTDPIPTRNPTPSPQRVVSSRWLGGEGKEEDKEGEGKENELEEEEKAKREQCIML